MIRNSRTFNLVNDNPTARNYLALAYCILGKQIGQIIKHPSTHNICATFDLYDEKANVRVVQKKSAKAIDYGKIIIKDLETDLISEYENIEIVARELNSDIKAIKQAIRSKHVFRKRYRIASKNKPDLEVHKSKNNPVMITNIITGQKLIKKSSVEAAKHFLITPPQVSYLLKYNKIFKNEWKIERIAREDVCKFTG
ncbi:MAG: hypothetical protein RSC09_06405 [Clostridia bacterium]